MQIYIIRHGETDGNVKGIFQGNTDFPLNEKGKELARLTGHALKDIRFQECLSSPLSRASQTAEIVLRESGNTDCPIIYDDRLREIHFGDWEMKKMRHGECEVPEEDVRLFFTDPFKLRAFPGGENVFQVCKRTQDFLKELINRNDDRTYLISVHGCAFRAMLNSYYDDPSDFWQGGVPLNCSLSMIKTTEGTSCLVFDNIIFYDRSKIVDRYSGMK